MNYQIGNSTIEAPDLPRIEGFRGEYEFLSNFYPATIVYEGITYPTAEHAYQAQKTTNNSIKQKIASLPYPGAAKKYGAKIEGRREDWWSVRYEIMDQILTIKFQDPVLQKKLLDTGNAVLVETNYWGDTFWGVCNGTGSNILGTLLMSVRTRINLVGTQPMKQPIVAFGNLENITSMELKP